MKTLLACLCVTALLGTAVAAPSQATAANPCNPKIQKCY